MKLKAKSKSKTKRRKPPGIALRFTETDAASISASVQAAVERAVNRISDTMRIEHHIDVECLPACALAFPSKSGDNNTYAFGGFRYPEPLQIKIACLPPITDRQWSLQVVHTLAHELGHYEQWRDGLAMTERGVNSRARRILRDAGIALPHYLLYSSAKHRKTLRHSLRKVAVRA